MYKSKNSCPKEGQIIRVDFKGKITAFSSFKNNQFM